MDISLREWVTEVGGARAAAETIGIAEVTVWKYLSGDRRPRPEIAAKIERLSGGRVRKEALIWPSEAA
jgi:DNA-binding transcriptional regulator YdaS (Cro superfamily)